MRKYPRPGAKIFNKQKISLVLLGIFLCIVLLEIGLRTGGFIISSLQEQKNTSALKEKDVYRIMCLGESTTVWGGEYSWPAQLQEILNKKNIGTEFRIINKGRHAIESSVILSELEANLDKYNPDMVITMMGLNDGDYTIPFENKFAFKIELFFTRLRAVKLAKIIWGSIVNKIEQLKFNDRRKENVKLDNYGKGIELESNHIEQERYTDTGEKNIKAIELNPGNDSAYADLGHSYNNQGRYPEAEAMFKEAIEVNPGNDSAYAGLGACYDAQKNYPEAEAMFKEAIELNPGNHSAYDGLENYYYVQGRYAEAEAMFKKAIEVNPHRDWLYIILGMCYKAQGRYREAEGLFRKALEINPESDRTYMRLGCCYRDEKRYQEAESVLKKAIKINPKNADAYLELALCYRDRGEEKGREIKEEKMLKMAIETNPTHDWAYIHLGWYYIDTGNYPEAEAMFKEAIELNPLNAVPYIELGNCYEEQGKLKESEELVREATRLLGRGGENLHRYGYLSDRLYGYLAIHYLKQKDYKSAEKYFKKANRIRLSYYPQATYHNYQRLKEIISKRGIKLVCVQYPMRSVKSLKKLFDFTDNVIFVDNERVFKEALRYGKYEDYFRDSFGGDFGHGTPKGNRLLAENVANVILKEVFHQ